MSKRYKVKRFSSCYLMNWVDNKTNKELTALEIEEILHKQEKRIAELKKQLAITEKALELACERVKYFEEMQDREMGFDDFFGYESNYDLQAIIEQYKQQAKEMLENEKRR